jgi:hypothetical protein
MSISRLMMQAAAGSGGPPKIGDAFEGGFYAGNIIQGGVEYYIIVSPKASGFLAAPVQVKTSNSFTSGTDTLNDGFSATAAMVAAGGHPAANFCAGLTINGYSDWYLPARDELEVCYRNLKPSDQANNTTVRSKASQTYPEGNDVAGDIMGRNRNSNPTGAGYTTGDPTETPLTPFRGGGSESFNGSIYASSTQFGTGSTWIQIFNEGPQTGEGKVNTFFNVRAIRRVPV